ncbi:hypothetical protein FSP39_018436 [Pinctada imbricata]|uniref:Uncharacterized protein n=1 Tax=Pinctada imbricata TaxID=66713 RepID=A0AA88XSW7_PINIB|nr:hypothetical protein FSP39_018436 [Pinctada imbricata]
MTEFKRPPLEGLFQTKGEESDSLLPVKQQIEHFEQKSRLNFNKSRPAPPPPGAQIQLPKIGNYQPKILLRSRSDDSKNDSDSNVPHSARETTGIYSRHFNRSVSQDSDNSAAYQKLQDNDNLDISKKYMIIGDKDVPITVHQTDHTDEEQGNTYYSPYGTENPAFVSDNKTVLDNENTESATTLDFEEVSKKTIFDEDFDENKENFDAGNVKNNPLFGKDMPIDIEDENKDDIIDDTPIPPPRRKNKPAPARPASMPPMEYPVKPAPRLDSVSETEEPYIPEPDYDDDVAETKYSKYSEVPRKPSLDNQRSNNFSKFTGEDYSQYLSDDEDYFSDHTYTWRKNIQYRRKGPSQTGKQRPISHPQKGGGSRKPQGGLKPLGKTKHDPKMESIKRNTIRDFSFSDSKIGYGDRTVKSTSAKGRYEKRNKERPRIDGSEGSYEEFLRMRSNENGSSSSADSGHDTGDDMYLQNNVFANSQPRQVRERKGSMWQRLTWKFKRHSAYQLS